MNSIYFTAPELENLKQMKTLPSHSAIWNNIKSYADSKLSASAPPMSTSSNKQTVSLHNGKVKRHIESMAFMYCMTDDIIYANSAIAWMVSVSGWSRWGTASSSWFNDAILMRAFAFAYSALKDVMSAVDKQVIIDSLAWRVKELYLHQKVWREAGIRDEGQAHYPFPNHEFTMASNIGLVGLILQGAHGDAQTWYDFGRVAAEDYLGGARIDFTANQLSTPKAIVPHAADFGPDGDNFEGESYTLYTLLEAMPYLAAMKTAGINYFTSEFLSNSAYYFIYMLYGAGSGSTYGSKGWLAMEDSENHFGFQTATGAGQVHPEGIQFMYKLAMETNNGYAQSLARQHSDDYTIFAYIWNDPNLAPLPIAELPLSRHFRAAGYVLWRDSWTGQDLVVLFKSGSSRAHAHQDQNSFSIWNNSDKITGNPGVGAKHTREHNCLLVRNSDSGLMEGQAIEWGDNKQNVVLNTRGVIEDVVETPYYRYARGNAAAVYKPKNRFYSAYGGNLGSYPYNGILDKWLRHIVLMKDPSYLVIYDDIVAPDARQVNWLMNSARFNGYSTSRAPAKRPLSISGNTISIGNALRTLVIEPEAFNSTVTFHPATGTIHNYDYAQIYRPTSVAAQKFLTVHFIGSDTLPTQAVKTGNCQGVIVDVGDEKYLTLFSSNGQSVNEYIELGGSYESADGSIYSFENTGIRAQFSTPYKVMELRPASTTPIGKGTLSISVTGGGTTDPTAGSHEYDLTTTVQITATPTAGHKFTQWGGDVSGTEPIVEVVMDADKNVVAYFEVTEEPPQPQQASTAPIAIVIILIIIAAVIAARRR